MGRTGLPSARVWWRLVVSKRSRGRRRSRFGPERRRKERVQVWRGRRVDQGCSRLEVWGSSSNDDGVWGRRKRGMNVDWRGRREVVSFAGSSFSEASCECRERSVREVRLPRRLVRRSPSSSWAGERRCSAYLNLLGRTKSSRYEMINAARAVCRRTKAHETHQ